MPWPGRRSKAIGGYVKNIIGPVVVLGTLAAIAAVAWWSKAGQEPKTTTKGAPMPPPPGVPPS